MDTAFTKAADLVGWLGCIQAQDFAGAKWAIGSRLKGGGEITDTGIEQEFREGKIIRTHILRPTWHFVTPADIRWIMALTADRVKAFCAGSYRNLELDKEVLKRSNATLKKALKGGRQLMRKELASVLQRAGIRTDDIRLSHLLMWAELDGVICSGGLNGKQFTYALMEEWVPEGRVMAREEALAELALRYFRSRGPATPADFAWWSGLTIADAKAGIEGNRSQYEKIEMGGRTYVYAAKTGDFAGKADAVVPGEDVVTGGSGLFVLPAYDEYTVAYTDRELILHPKHAERGGNGIFKPVIIRDGQVVGTWQREIKKDGIVIKTDLFRPVGKRMIKAAFARYGAFMGKEVIVDAR